MKPTAHGAWRVLCAVTLCTLAPLTSLATTSGAVQTKLSADYSTMARLLAVMNTEANQLNNANQLFLQSCMRSQGFIFYPDVKSPTVGSGSGPMPKGAALTIASAATGGYGLYALFESYATRSASGNQSTTQENRYEATLSKKRQSAYNLAEYGPANDRFNFNVPGIGVMNGPRKGCAATADKETFGSVLNAALVPNAPARIYSEWVLKITSDGRVSNLYSQWAGCMALAGFNFKSPDVVYQVLQHSYETNGPTSSVHRIEIKTAVADVNCELEKSWRANLQDAEGQDAAGVMRSESSFILHAQERNKVLLAKLSIAG